jgi:hypothetical protein
MWQVYTRPNSASDFFFLLSLYMDYGIYILKVLVSLQKFWNFYFAQIMFLLIKSHKTWKKTMKNFPSVTCRRRRWQKFVLHLQPRPYDLESWNFGSRILSGQLDVLHTHNFKFRFLRVPLFWDFVKERFSWPENGFIVFRRYNSVEKSVVQFILGRNFLNKTSNLNFA